MAKIVKHHKPDCRGSKCECPYRLDFRPQGVKGPRKRIEFPTKKAAEKYLTAISTKVSRNEYIDPAKIPAFAAAAEAWFASKTDRRPSHVADLRSRLDKHILPRIGRERLDYIKVGTIEKLRDDLRAEGYAPRTINSIIRITSAVFRAALRRGEATTNPVDRIERAFMAAREIDLFNGHESTDSNTDAVDPAAVLSVAEVRRLIDVAAPAYYRILFMSAFITGMRSGELLALQWGDIEFDDGCGHGKIHVRRTLSWARVNRAEPIRARFYPPKTKAGTRTLTIHPDLVSILKAWKLPCPPSKLDLVFPHENGEPNDRDRILRVGLYPALRRAGLRQVNFHSLRHACASAMIAAGAPVTEIQHRLGHRDASVTLKVYSHFLRDMETGTADRLAEMVVVPIGSVSPRLAPYSGKPEKWAKTGHWNDAPDNAIRVSA